MTERNRQMGGDPASQRTQFDPARAQQMEQSDNPQERHGTYEPDDSRNVTGAGGGGIGTPGGSDQQVGGERWGGAQMGQQSDPRTTPDAAGQEQGEEVEFDPDPSLEQSGEEIEFEPSEELGGQMDQQGQRQSQQSGSLADMDQASSGQYGAGQAAQEFGENTAADQMSQYDSASGGQMGGGQTGGGQAGLRQWGDIREHMEVVGADGVHLGTVDCVKDDRIVLTKADSGMGSHQGHHHTLSRGLVAEVEGDKVRLSATAANAYAMLEEE